MREGAENAEKTAHISGSRLSDYKACRKDQTLEPAAKGRINGLPSASKLD